MTINPRNRSEKGAVSAVVIIAIAVVMVISLVYVDAYRAVHRARQKVALLNVVSQIQLNIRNTVNDPGSWATTFNRNSEMDCFKTRSCTTLTAPTPFVLWPAGASSGMDDLAVYDGRSATAGFTINGDKCNTFTSAGNLACPIHVVLRWATPGCVSAPCDPLVLIQADVQFRAGDFLSTNETKLELTFAQKLAGGDVKCLGAAPTTEAATCAARPYIHDQLICTSTGWRCGTVYF